MSSPLRPQSRTASPSWRVLRRVPRLSNESLRNQYHILTVVAASCGAVSSAVHLASGRGLALVPVLNVLLLCSVVLAAGPSSLDWGRVGMFWKLCSLMVAGTGMAVAASLLGGGPFYDALLFGGGCLVAGAVVWCYWVLYVALSSSGAYVGGASASDLLAVQDMGLHLGVSLCLLWFGWTGLWAAVPAVGAALACGVLAARRGLRFLPTVQKLCPKFVLDQGMRLHYIPPLVERPESGRLADEWHNGRELCERLRVLMRDDPSAVLCSTPNYYELSRKLAVSYSKLARCMKTATGNTIGNMVTAYRVQRAVDLWIEDPFKPQDQILQECGWKSVDSMDGDFEKITGLSPGRWIAYYRLTVDRTSSTPEAMAPPPPLQTPVQQGA